MLGSDRDHSVPTEAAGLLVRVGGSSAFQGYPAGVVACGLLFLSGLRPVAGCAAPLTFDDLPRSAQIGRQGFSIADEQEEEVAVDAWAAHDELDRVLASVGSSQEHMLRMRIWQRDKRFYPAYERVRMVRQPVPSSSSGHSVSALLGQGGRAIGLDGVAIAARYAGADAERSATGTAQTERPLTYYSVAAQHGAYAFLAGHIPVKRDPGFPTVQSFEDVTGDGRRYATGRSHTDSRDGPIAAQTWYVYDQMRENLEKIGAGLDDVAHCLVGLKDLRDLPMFHRVHKDTFGDQGPALTIIGAGEVGHRNSRLVVEPTVYLSKSDIERVDWPGRPPLSAPMARRAGGLLFVSGMSGIDQDARFVDSIDQLPRTGRTALRGMSAWTGHAELPPQCWQAWSNLATALERGGSSLRRLVKLTVFVSSPGDWPVFDSISRIFLGDQTPAIECVAVPHPGPSARSFIQIDAVAEVG